MAAALPHINNFLFGIEGVMFSDHNVSRNFTLELKIFASKYFKSKLLVFKVEIFFVNLHKGKQEIDKVVQE